MAKTPELNPEFESFSPNDLEAAKARRLDALKAVIERANAVLADDQATNAARNDALRRKQHAEREIEGISLFGFSWPAHSGYPA